MQDVLASPVHNLLTNRNNLLYIKSITCYSFCDFVTSCSNNFTSSEYQAKFLTIVNNLQRKQSLTQHVITGSYFSSHLLYIYTQRFCFPTWNSQTELFSDLIFLSQCFLTCAVECFLNFCIFVYGRFCSLRETAWGFRRVEIYSICTAQVYEKRRSSTCQ